MITPGSSICGVVNDMNFVRADDFVAALNISTCRVLALPMASSQLDTGTIWNRMASLVSISFRKSAEIPINYPFLSMDSMGG